jgi:hypothetical protein
MIHDQTQWPDLTHRQRGNNSAGFTLKYGLQHCGSSQQDADYISIYGGGVSKKNEYLL